MSCCLKALLLLCKLYGHQHMCLSGSAETTLVIVVSVSLALLVCAIIPLIFCRHCRSSPGELTHAHIHTCTYTLLSLCGVISNQNHTITSLACLFQKLGTNLNQTMLRSVTTLLFTNSCFYLQVYYKIRLSDDDYLFTG